SALAMALSSVFFTGPAIRLREKVSSASARSTFLPRIMAATRLSFWPEVFSVLRTALASLSLSARLVFCLPMLLPLGLLVGRVPVIGAGRGELAELVADHLFVDVHRHVLVAVVNTEGQADELRQDGRAAAPDLDDLVAARGPRRIRLLQHVPVDERAFPERTSHGLPPLLEMTRADDELVRRLVGTGLLALGRLAPRGHRVTTTGGAAFAAAMRVIDRVHGDATVDRLLAEPAIAPGLADRGVGMVVIGHRADRREARAMHAALLARIEAQDRPTLVAADILGIG